MASGQLPRQTFGSTAVQVPKVGLGTWYLEQSDSKTAITAVRQALDLGLTHMLEKGSDRSGFIQHRNNN